LETQVTDKTNKKTKRQTSYLLVFLSALWLTFACSGDVEHMAPAIGENDSVPFMHARGINTLISDSGVMRYHMVAEEWDIFTQDNRPATWKFVKGLLMERFDEKFHIDLYVQSDTAYLHEQKVWELRGRVVVRNVKGDVFHTEELFWDMIRHEMYNHSYMRITTPERELEGTEFRSDEQMTKYYVNNSKGAFPVSDTQEQQADTTANSTATKTNAGVQPKEQEQREKVQAQEKGAALKPKKFQTTSRMNTQTSGNDDNAKKTQ